MDCQGLKLPIRLKCVHFPDNLLKFTFTSNFFIFFLLFNLIFNSFSYFFSDFKKFIKPGFNNVNSQFYALKHKAYFNHSRLTYKFLVLVNSIIKVREYDSLYSPIVKIFLINEIAFV